jgi:hypothetical protein
MNHEIAKHKRQDLIRCCTFRERRPSSNGEDAEGDGPKEAYVRLNAEKTEGKFQIPGALGGEKPLHQVRVERIGAEEDAAGHPHHAVLQVWHCNCLGPDLSHNGGLGVQTVREDVGAGEEYGDTK